MKKPIHNLVSLILISLSLIACVRDVVLTPLMPPASSGDISSVKKLLSEGVDVNEKNRDGETALMVASETGQLQIVRELLANGADVNAVSVSGRTALKIATRKGYTEMVEMLIANGADLDAQQVVSERSPLVTLAPSQQITALDIACSGNYSDIAEMLIANGANVNIGSGPPLHYCANKGNTRIVNKLISAGADVNATCGDNQTTALMTASYNGHLDVVKTLIRSNADVNAKTTNGYTALYAATRKGHVDVVRELLNHGAEVKIAFETWKTDVGDCSETPLEASRHLKQTEITELLENAGAVAREPFSQETLNDFALKDIGYLDQRTNKFIIPLMSTGYDSRVRQIDLILGETTSHQVKRIFHDDWLYDFGVILHKSNIQGPDPGFPKKAIENAVYSMSINYGLLTTLIFDLEKKLIVVSLNDIDHLQVYVPCSKGRKIMDKKQKNIRILMQKYRFSEIDKDSSYLIMRSNIKPCVVVYAWINRERDKIDRIDYMFVCPTR